MSLELLAFDDVLKQINTHQTNNRTAVKKCLLLGNGFSVAYNAKRFSYTNLLETALNENIISRNSNIHKVFQKLNTADFEKVIRYMDGLKNLIKIYQPDFDKKQLERDIKNLKKHLVNTITNNHPESSKTITNEESKACASFLRNFHKIYSLNYDLLAYWVIMQNRGLSYSDGFGDNAEDNGYDPENPDCDYESYLDEFVVYKDTTHDLMFLHGGLHLYDHNTEAIKLTFCRTDKILKKQIFENLVRGIYPIFISEGHSKDKLEKIRHNYYLNHCYKSLTKQGGDLVIFGTALKSNDEHIRKAIIEGSFSNIYAGVFGEDDAKSLSSLSDDIKLYNNNHPKKRNKTQVYLYDARQVNPWGRQL
ncbi:MAG: hypothetical protein A2Y12_03960 [Planctomycetes bacterium GWF2_42_9]|nr:MAG: hypothetical protein A2Y12_03960 [Planctomycetes bacterium GWF2_42_9]